MSPVQCLHSKNFLTQNYFINYLIDLYIHTKKSFLCSSFQGNALLTKKSKSSKAPTRFRLSIHSIIDSITALDLLTSIFFNPTLHNWFYLIIIRRQSTIQNCSSSFREIRLNVLFRLFYLLLNPWLSLS